MSKTISISQEGPANALSLNRDLSQVVIAGRNVFKIFSIEEDQFVETCNLRVGKNINLNYSCNDVAWSTVDDHILATAATNGAVVIWNLNRPSRSKQDHVFNEHERTVNKVCFGLNEPNWLMSGSQDGTMKMFDLRTKESIRTFISNTESVRDVQFSPHVHFLFVSVSENGNVQCWDVRKPDRCLLQFTSHSGPVFACDWHPDVNWLATASRDKTIKIWDMSSKPCLEFTIHTIASVGRVKWRPLHKHQIGSAALVVDSSINVWDVRRPYIAFATFTAHKDVATSVAWRDSQTLLSTSRDCTLYQHAFKDSIDPSARINPHALAFSPLGQIAFSCKASPNSVKITKMQGLLKKVGNIATGVGAPTPESEFARGTNSNIYMYSQVNRETDWIVKCAKTYILSGMPLPDICEHNSRVAKNQGRFSASQVWQMVKSVMGRMSGESGGWSPEDSSVIMKERRSGSLWRSLEDPEVEELSVEEELVKTDWTLPAEAFSVRPDTSPLTPTSQSDDEAEEDMEGLCDVRLYGVRYDCAEALGRAISHHAISGDLQTPACVLAVLGQAVASPLLACLPQDSLETWLLTYLDLLARFKLYLHANQMVKLSWLEGVNVINQESTTMHTACGGCNKSLISSGWNCSRCGDQTHCSICHNIVRGLYVWCQGCMHGGHVEHMKKWFSKRVYCPTGCGHACQFT